MTQSEITKKSNLYKNELNKCKIHIDNYGQSINAFSKFKSYLSISKDKAKKHKKLALIHACICIGFTLFCSFVSLPIAFILLVASIALIERFAFFSKVFKKFENCVNYLSKIITNLTNKQFDYVIQRDYALEEIIKLENMVPEVISQYLEPNENSKLEENLDVLSL